MSRGNKNQKIQGKGFAVLMLCCAVVLFCSVFTSAAYAEEYVGKFSAVDGRVDLLKNGKMPAIIAEAGLPVSPNDIVRTKSNSKAEIAFNDGNVIRLAEKTRLALSEYISGGTASLFLSIGKVEASVAKKLTKTISLFNQKSRFELRTPNAVAGVRGTEYHVGFDGSVTQVIVKEGVVAVINHKLPDMPVIVTGGHFTVVEQQKAPTQEKPVTTDTIKKLEKEVTPERKKGPEKKDITPEKKSSGDKKESVEKKESTDKKGSAEKKSEPQKQAGTTTAKAPDKEESAEKKTENKQQAGAIAKEESVEKKPESKSQTASLIPASPAKEESAEKKPETKETPAPIATAKVEPVEKKPEANGQLGAPPAPTAPVNDLQKFLGCNPM
ncbi:MAG: hypothetical protein EPN22_10265 [Nitrospirae bacterium]|nr:MAG: hypothetical protein EPN22_10265 [Nitrospirota bacterium]